MGKQPTTAELTAMRTEAPKFFPELANIKRYTKVDEEYGGETSTETTVATGVPCTITPGMYLEEVNFVQGGQLREANWFEVTVPYGTDVKVTDVLVVTTQNNTRLRVENDLEPLSYGTLRSLYCTKD